MTIAKFIGLMSFIVYASIGTLIAKTIRHPIATGLVVVAILGLYVAVK